MQITKEVFDIYQDVIRNIHYKKCFVSECTNDVIRAHSIQNSRILRPLSKNGLLIMPKPKNWNLADPITEWGRNEATIFTGFCGKHDSELFKLIDENPFDESYQQIFLYTYRCLAYEYYTKYRRYLVAKEMTIRPIEKKYKNYFRFEAKACFGASNDFIADKNRFEEALKNGNKILESVVWYFPYKINFAACSTDVLWADISGKIHYDTNKVQQTNKKRLRHFYVTIFPEENRSVCIISWLLRDKKMFSNFKIELESLTEEQRKYWLNHFLPLTSDNIVFNPDSWNKMSNIEKEFYRYFQFNPEISHEYQKGNIEMLEPLPYDLFSI